MADDAELEDARLRSTKDAMAAKALDEEELRKPFAPPTDAGDLAYARFWYYADNDGLEQGPFGTAMMREWFEAGYLPVETRTAASYYGEVPHTLWQIAQLWDDPNAHAFRLADDAPADLGETAAPKPEYVEAPCFEGKREGYAFKSDYYGIGYYLDKEPTPEVTRRDALASPRPDSNPSPPPPSPTLPPPLPNLPLPPKAHPR